MPVSYGDSVAEYWSLVNDVTLWDVTCQRQVEIAGPDALKFIQYLTPRDMSRCQVGQCQYLLLTDENGGVINDAVMLRVGEQQFWLSPGDGDVLLWALGVAVGSGMDVRIHEPDVSPLQLQGPKAPLVARDLFGDWALEMKYYWLKETTLDGIPLVVSRTGWSGELGYELYLRDGQYGEQLWQRVMEAGKPYNIAPAAPSAIRSVEGGILSYGSDITRDDDPFVLGFDRLIDLDQADDFIGKEALRKIRADGPKRRLVGVNIGGEAFAASNGEYWPVTKNGQEVGRVTRSLYSPRLERNIGFVNVPVEHAAPGTELTLQTPAEERSAVVCDVPWFPAQKKIPADL
jgi:aminomethyltransferase